MTNHVLHVIASLRPGGQTSQLVTLTTGLVAKGFAVHVVALRDGPMRSALTAAGAKVRIVPRRHRFDPLVIARLRRVANEVRPAVVHVWDAPATAFAHAAKLRPVVASVYCRHAKTGGWRQWFGGRIQDSVSKHLAANALIADSLQHAGVAEDRIAVAPRAVSPAPTETALPKQQVFDELGLPAAARAIAVVANLTPKKNIKELIWHADLVRVLNDDIRVVIFGDGPIRPELERFARMASDLEHVRFAGYREDLRQLLPSFEMLWHAGDESAPPVAVLEAMAAGLPVVADRTPGPSEAIVDGETGFLIPVAGRAERGRVTEQLLNDSSLRDLMGQAARQRATTEFAVGKAVEATIAAYESVLPEAAPA